jgi:hypothetical protein
MRRAPSSSRRFAFGLLLGCCATVWAAPPGLGPLRAVDAPVVAPATLVQQNAGIAFGGGQYLAVWEDWHDTASSGRAIRAARLSTDGAILDDPPLVVVDSSALVANPAVAWDGAQFLVVWQGPSGVSVQAGDIFGAYVDGTGAVGATFTVVGAAESQYQPVVAGGDGYALVAWTSDVVGSSQVRAALFGQAGNVLKADFALNPTFTNRQEDTPAVAWGGPAAMRFLAAWQRPTAIPTRIYGATVDLTGTPSAQFQISATGSDASEAALASDGTTFVAVWGDDRNFPNQDLYGRAIPFLAAPTAADYPVALAPMGGGFLRPQVTLAAGNLFVVWEAPVLGAKAVLYGGRMSADGTRVDGDGTAISSAPPVDQRLLPSQVDARRAALASDGSKTLTVWATPSAGVTDRDVFVLPSDPSAATLTANASSPLGRARNYQISRSLGSDGDVFLLVWEDDRNVVASGLDLYGLRVGHDGNPVDPAPFVICDAPGDQFSPAVAAWPGGDFLVAWADGRNLDSGGDVDLYATRLGAVGAPVDGTGFVVSQAANAQLYPTVAAKPDGWLVAWEDWRSAPSGKQYPGVWSTVVDSSGALGGEHAIQDAFDDSSTACDAGAAWNGSRFLVVYEQPCSTTTSTVPLQWDLFGRWLDPTGAIELSTLTVASQAGNESVPQVARIADSTDLVVTWREQMTGERILATRVSNGAAGVGSPVQIAAGNGSHEAPAVAGLPGPNGPLLFTWIEGNPPAVMARVAAAGLSAADLEPPFPVLMQATLRATAPADLPPATPAGVAASLVPRVTPLAAVAVAPGGEALVALDQLDLLAGKSTSRLYHRRLGILPRGASCASSGGCADAICSNGACCDTPCDGICQACGPDGCVLAPQRDARCGSGTVSCAGLSTQCRIYADATLDQCAAFGQCVDPLDPGLCSTFTAVPDGSACARDGCTGRSACQGGDCVCADESLPTAPLRKPRAAGCQLAPGARGGGGWWLVGLAIGLALLRRTRRAALVGLLLLGGCREQTALELTLRLSDPVFSAADSVRLVLAPSDGSSLPPSGVAQMPKGIVERNVDLDGDGRVDAVYDLPTTFPFAAVNRFEVTPAVERETKLDVRVEVFDSLHDRFASASASAILTPGRRTSVEVSPGCLQTCPDATVQHTINDAIETLALPGDVTALAAGNLTAAAAPRADLVVATAHVGTATQPNAGRVTVFFGGARPLRAEGDVVLDGAAEGDQLGASLAAGDLDGDGADDLVVGAPGANGAKGAIYVYYGGAGFSPSSPVAQANGQNAGDRLGSALALADVDGDGRPDVLAGAPGARRLYALSASLLARGAALEVGNLPSLGAAASSGLGTAVAARGDLIVVGAPLEASDGNPAGAIYLVDRATGFQPGTVDVSSLPRALGPGGGFGSAVSFVDLAGDGKLAVLAGAPQLDAGVLFILDAATRSVLHSVHAASSGIQLGSALASRPTPFGDQLFVGAPAFASGAQAGPGAAFAFNAATLSSLPAFHLDAAGHPAAAAFNGAHAADAVGQHLLVADFDGDRAADLAASGGSQVYLFGGPLP